MIELDEIQIDFDCNKETPYFQVTPQQRIRFGMEDLNITLIRAIIKNVFAENDNLSLLFVSENIINNRRFSSKSGIGKIIKIKNWYEKVAYDASIGEGIVYTTIKNLTCNDVIRYCSEVYKGHNEAYISFFNNKSLIYVSNDVVDIVSSDVEMITELKQKYSDRFDKYYESNPF